MSRRVEQRIRALVRHVAPTARVYFPRLRRRHPGLSWNGRHLRPSGLTLESQLHDVAHLLVAPPERHALPEFGLGADPYRRKQLARVVPREEADREELDACAVQLLLAGELGLDEAAVRLEVSTPPLTLARIRELASRYPYALPDEVWARAEGRVSASTAPLPAR